MSNCYTKRKFLAVVVNVLFPGLVKVFLLPYFFLMGVTVPRRSMATLFHAELDGSSPIKVKGNCFSAVLKK